MIGEKLGPYEIISSIGSGGMGEVWKARDTRLGRIVAIKKVKEQHSERFKQEARSIAALNHPNICQIFDIGDDYLVLEYVEGKPLSSPLPEQEVVRLAIQIATALDAAHKKGIIHRDLKPANIMVTDEGSVKLLDFGLARLYEQDQSISNLPTEDFPATQAGAILGTVAYMSPEQAQGLPADARSDIFSFGLVLYEMLSGRRAFSGESSFAVMTAIVSKEPDSVQASSQLEKIVKRCLEKKPAERYQTMAELKAELERGIKPKVTVSSEEPQPSIAVLPFVNMSGDKEQEYFSDGLAEEIINALTKIPGLKVPARTSSFYFRGKEADIHEISSRLNVNNILEGSVRKSGNRIRVTAQLINTKDGYHLWSERYDRDMTDIFAIQDEISQAIAEKLRVQISGDRPLVKPKTKNLDAYNLFLKGRYYLTKFTPEGFAKGKDFFEQAVSMDPHYAMAWQGLADFYFEMGVFGYMQSKDAFAKAMYAINKVLDLDQTIPEVHALVGTIKSANREWEAAEKAFKKALDLGQQSEAPEAWLYYSIWYLVPHKRIDEAFIAIKKGLDLDPLFPFFQIILAMYYYFTRQWDLALEQCRYALELHPDYYIAYQYLGFTYLQKGMNDEGIRFCKKAAEVIGKGQWTLTFPAIAYAKAGQLDEANRLLKELHDLAEQSPVSPTAFAWIYSSLGEIDKGLYWFEKAIDDHDGLIVWTHIFPIYDPLRSHPRYKTLLRKMNLEP